MIQTKTILLKQYKMINKQMPRNKKFTKIISVKECPLNRKEIVIYNTGKSNVRGLKEIFYNYYFVLLIQLRILTIQFQIVFIKNCFQFKCVAEIFVFDVFCQLHTTLANSLRFRCDMCQSIRNPFFVDATRRQTFRLTLFSSLKTRKPYKETH